MTPVAILISGAGTNMAALVDAMTGPFPARPCLVISSRGDAPGLDKAAQRGVPTAVVAPQDHADRAAYDAVLDDRLRAAGADLVCLAGFMRVLGPAFVDTWRGRVLNLHPSLLPAYRGLDTHARVLAAGEAWHGCTVHEVTAALDDGPILGQARVPVRPGDTAESLGARVRAMEHRLYPAVLGRVVEGDRRPVLLS